jgi:hypothetical protein
LVVEPDYLPDSEVCFSRAWTPFPNGGVWGVLPPTTVSRGVQGGDENFCSPPWWGIQGKCTPKVKYWEKLPCKIL